MFDQELSSGVMSRFGMTECHLYCLYAGLIFTVGP